MNELRGQIGPGFRWAASGCGLVLIFDGKEIWGNPSSLKLYRAGACRPFDQGCPALGTRSQLNGRLLKKCWAYFCKFLQDLRDSDRRVASMRIVRPEMSWRVLSPEWQGGSVCLQLLALRCGYRIGEICSELDCGERYLYEVFTRDIGLSPKEWMRRERMVVARRMLAGGKGPDEVAESLGFASKQNFRREFLAFYRVGPLEFQKGSWRE